MFNRKLKENLQYIELKVRRIERYIKTIEKRLDEYEEEYTNHKECICESKKT